MKIIIVLGLFLLAVASAAPDSLDANVQKIDELDMVELPEEALAAFDSEPESAVRSGCTLIRCNIACIALRYKFGFCRNSRTCVCVGW